MSQLMQVASQFPTIIYSILLGVVVIYWLIGLLGIIDLDFGGDIDVDIDTDISVGGMTGLFLTLGFSEVPFTLVISILTLICWLLSFYAQFYLLTTLADGWLYYLLGTVCTLVVFFVSIPITALIVRPFRGMFQSVEAASSTHFVGKEAIIATSTVNEKFGQARLFNDGAEILVDVRCGSEHSQALSLGSKVVVIEYHPENHTYIVAPYSLSDVI